MSATAHAGGGERARPRLHIHVHQTEAPEELPDTVVLLDRLLLRETHWVPDKVGQSALRGRTQPHTGEGCQYCSRTPALPIRMNHYAPALVHRPGHLFPDGSPVWTRVVFYVPNAAMKWFTNGRGAIHTVHRKHGNTGRGTRVVGQFTGWCHRLDEPAFHIDPVLQHAWFNSDDTKSELERLLVKLPTEILLPLLKEPAPTAPPAPPQFTDEERAEVLRLLEIVRGKRRPDDDQAGGGVPRPSSPKVDPPTLKGVKDTIKFKGKSISEREEDGTYQPRPTGTEGGAE